MYTIGELGKKFKLSRSTLLYYEKQGLLSPAIRKKNNYRFYNGKDVARLEKIIMYRDSGVALSDIKKLLEPSNNELSKILIERLANIHQEINILKKQEHLIIEVLKKQIIYDECTEFTAEMWRGLLVGLGYNESDTLEWHKNFEIENSQEHKRFLKSLKMNDEHIERLLIEIKSNRIN